MFIKFKKHFTIIGLLLICCFVLVIVKSLIDARNTKKIIQNFIEYTIQNGNHVTAGFLITGELDNTITEKDFLVSLENIFISYQTKFDKHKEACNSPDQIIYVFNDDNIVVAEIHFRGSRVYLYHSPDEDYEFIFDVSKQGLDKINELLNNCIIKNALYEKE